MSKRNFGSIKSLVHFDFPYFNEPNDGLDDEVRGAEWGRNGNVKLAGTQIPYEITGTPKFGYRCAYFPDTASYIASVNDDDTFDLNPSESYEFECFVKKVGEAGAILTLGDLELGIDSNNRITLASTTWGFDETSTTTISVGTYQHILLRINENSVKVYLDGAEAISTLITSSIMLTPSNITLGGFVGYMDEFVFRQSAGTEAPTVPTHPYSGILEPENVGGYGTGEDGNVEIDTDTQINSYGLVSSITDSQTLTVSSWSNGTCTPAAGCEVMLHITAPISTASAAYPSVGLYAFSKIAEINGTAITLTDEITTANGYDFTLESSLLTTYYVQVITVPNYESLTIDAGVTVSPLTWSTTTGGGIVAFRTTDDCTINGSIITHGKGAIRYDFHQMTNSKLIDRFLCSQGGGIFITCDGTFTALDTARLGATWSGLGENHNGATGYGGDGGIVSNYPEGLGGVGGGGGGSAHIYQVDVVSGGNAGCDGANATFGGGGGGCGGNGGNGNNNIGGSGGGGQGNSGGLGGSNNGLNSVSVNGGNSNYFATGNSCYHGGAGGGAPGGNGGDGRDSYMTIAAGGISGACIALVCAQLCLDSAAISTGGEAGSVEGLDLRYMGTPGGGGTGFCYIACREQVNENA